MNSHQNSPGTIRNNFVSDKLAFRRPLVLFLFLLLVEAMAGVSAQNIAGIITDYNGFWQSVANAVNPVKPDNSHNLLAFSYNGSTYSTGVNDSLLSAHGISFTGGKYKALPLYQVTGTVNSNTKIGLGAMYDGVDYGPGSTAPVNDLARYLNDGAQGLDLGTCVANLPPGDLLFPISSLTKQAIGDLVPDLLITQIADPSTSSPDRYEFADINGNRVGNAVNINLHNLPVLGNWMADFYEASAHPMILQSGFTHTQRAIRLWAADFSSFGIDSTNYDQVAYFRIRLNGMSDVAFVAYNNQAMDLNSSLLAFNFADLRLQNGADSVSIFWANSHKDAGSSFEVERSVNGTEFESISSNHQHFISTINSIIFTDKHPLAGKSFYRIKYKSSAGEIRFSSVLPCIRSLVNEKRITVYPNPASHYICLKLMAITDVPTVIRIFDCSGVLWKNISFPSNNTGSRNIPIENLPAGLYRIYYTTGSVQGNLSFIKE